MRAAAGAVSRALAAMPGLSLAADAPIIFAFKGNAEDGTLVVRPRGLQSDAVYDVRSLDVGPIGDASGEALMLDGIGIVQSGRLRAHVVILTKK